MIQTTLTTIRRAAAGLPTIAAAALLVLPLQLAADALAQSTGTTRGSQGATRQRQAPARGAGTAAPYIPIDQRPDVPAGLRPRRVAPLTQITGGPGLHFFVLDQELGRMTNAETLGTTFEFVNNGDQTLEIVDVVPACGCTKPTLAKRSYAPGERGMISVAFTPPTGGLQAKSMSVLSNAVSPGELVKIRVVADVEAVLSFEPRMHDFGEIPMGKPLTLSVDIKADAAKTYFDTLRVRGGDVQARFTQTPPLLGAATIEVVLPGNLPWGRLRSGVLQIGTRGQTEDGREITKQLPFRLTGVLVDDIRADKYVIGVGTPKPGDAFKGKVRVYQKDGKPFQIMEPVVVPLPAGSRGVADAEYNLEIVPATDEKGGYDVVLSGTVFGTSGFVTGNVTFKTKGEDGRIVQRSLGINGRVQHDSGGGAARPTGRVPAGGTGPRRPGR